QHRITPEVLPEVRGHRCVRGRAGDHRDYRGETFGSRSGEVHCPCLHDRRTERPRCGFASGPGSFWEMNPLVGTARVGDPGRIGPAAGRSRDTYTGGPRTRSPRCHDARELEVRVYDSLIDLVGDTPLVRLGKVTG